MGKNRKNRQVSLFGFQCVAKNTSGFYLDDRNFDYDQKLPGKECVPVITIENVVMEC